VAGGGYTKPVKIGVTADPRGRRRTLNHGAFPVDYIWAAALPRQTALGIEGLVKNLSRDRRVRGEWFAIDHEEFVPFVTKVTVDWCYDRGLHDIVASLLGEGRAERISPPSPSP
jgi:Meiotically up-regulated gene 113